MYLSEAKKSVQNVFHLVHAKENGHEISNLKRRVSPGVRFFAAQKTYTQMRG
jgi:hypothetical protein